MERHTATLEGDVCFEGCPDGCDKRQGTRGKRLDFVARIEERRVESGKTIRS